MKYLDLHLENCKFVRKIHIISVKMTFFIEKAKKVVYLFG